MGRLKNPKDAAAWDDFQRVYGGLIAHWARSYGLSNADTEDLVQDVLLDLVSKFWNGRLVYDPARGSFRAYLCVAVRNRVFNLLRTRKRTPQHLSLLEDADGASFTGDAGRSEYEARFVLACLEAIRPRFDPVTWRCFELFVFHGLKAKEVVATLGLTGDKPDRQVYRSASTVLAELRGYAGRLDPDLPPDPLSHEVP
jgi:RNA polymerase sigma factor (sigma-70 family)